MPRKDSAPGCQRRSLSIASPGYLGTASSLALPREALVLSVYNPDFHVKISPLKVLLLKKLKTTLSGDPNFRSSKLGRMEPQHHLTTTMLGNISSQPKSYFPFGKTEARHRRIEVHVGCEVFG